MKKATLFLALVAMMAMGTTASAQLTFSAKAGLNTTTMTWKTETTTYEPGWLLGFNVGVGMEIGLTDILALEVDALFSRKGCKREEQGLVTQKKYTNTTSLFYVDVPVNIKAYFLTLGSDLKLYAQAGPYVGFGLFGKYKYITESADGKSTTKHSDEIKWGDTGNDDFRRLDWGADVGLGLEYDRLSVGLIWWQGIANIASVQTSNTKNTHRGLSVELGWKF